MYENAILLLFSFIKCQAEFIADNQWLVSAANVWHMQININLACKAWDVEEYFSSSDFK